MKTRTEVEVWRCSLGHEERIEQCLWDPATEAEKREDYQRFHDEDYRPCRLAVELERVEVTSNGIQQ